MMNRELTFKEQVEKAVGLITPLAEVRGLNSREIAGLLYLSECYGLHPLDAAGEIRSLLLRTNLLLTFWQWFEMVYFTDRVWEVGCRLLRRPDWRWSWQRRATNFDSLLLLNAMIENRRISREWFGHFADSLRGSEYELLVNYFRLGLVEGDHVE